MSLINFLVLKKTIKKCNKILTSKSVTSYIVYLIKKNRKKKPTSVVFFLHANTRLYSTVRDIV